MTEDELVGWHHRLDGHEFGQAPGVGDGQVSLACCSPWGCKESDMAEQLMNQVMALKGAIQITKLYLPKSLSIPSRGNACLPGKSRKIAEFKT